MAADKPQVQLSEATSLIGCTMMLLGGFGTLLGFLLVCIAFSGLLRKPSDDPRVPAELVNGTLVFSSLRKDMERPYLLVSDTSPSRVEVTFGEKTTLGGDWTGSDAIIEADGKTIIGEPARTRPLLMTYFNRESFSPVKFRASFTINGSDFPEDKIVKARVTMKASYPSSYTPGNFVAASFPCFMEFSICRLNPEVTASLKKQSRYEGAWRELPAFLIVFGVSALVTTIGTYAWKSERKKAQLLKKQAATAGVRR